MSEAGGFSKKLINILSNNLIVILVVAISLLMYGAGYLVFPISILSSYHNKNCDSVLSQNRIYTNIYPDLARDQSLFSVVGECDRYTKAVASEQAGNWQSAYDAYQNYLKRYPHGLYVNEANEHSAVTLMGLAKDQAAQQSYGEALTNLNLIISNYPNSSVSPDALRLAPSLYATWGSSLRESGNFDKAEQTFNDFRAWTQNNGKPELEIDALDGLAQTYLDWGLTLQTQKQFEAALAKFGMAATVDPKSSFNAPKRAKKDQRKLYMMWGNDLLGQDEFSAAIEKFKLAVSSSDGNNEDGVSDALANGYIQWAQKYGADEDFEGALDQLAIAGQTAISEAMKKSVDEALGEMYLAFSKSDGIQAKRAMRAAWIAVCDKHTKPDLPIFGLNKKSIRFGIYGVDTQLPDELAARTPGEMHYVACVKNNDRTVDARTHVVNVLITSQGHFYQVAWQYRAEHVWDVRLIKTDTLEDVADMTFTGGNPPPFPKGFDGTYIYGSPPDMAEVAKWLQSVINK